VNATGNQTYNVTLSAAGDWVTQAIQINEVLAFTPVDPFGQNGFFGL